MPNSRLLLHQFLFLLFKMFPIYLIYNLPTLSLSPFHFPPQPHSSICTSGKCLNLAMAGNLEGGRCPGYCIFSMVSRFHLALPRFKIVRQTPLIVLPCTLPSGSQEPYPSVTVAESPRLCLALSGWCPAPPCLRADLWKPLGWDSCSCPLCLYHSLSAREEQTYSNRKGRGLQAEPHAWLLRERAHKKRLLFDSLLSVAHSFTMGDPKADLALMPLTSFYHGLNKCNINTFKKLLKSHQF